jgi:subtilisin family serine protease
MFDPSRVRKWSGSFLSPSLLAVLAVLAVGPALRAQSQDLSSLEQLPDLKSAKAGKPMALTALPTLTGLPDTVSPTLRASAASLMSTGREQRIAASQGNPVYYLLFHAEFDSAGSRQRLRVPGASILTAFDRFAELFVPLSPDQKGPDQAAYKALISTPGLVWLELSEVVEVPPAPAFRVGAPTRSVPEQIVRGGYAGLTGKGVIVAVIDSGLDFRNADFINFDPAGRPTSRLLYLWDTMTNAFDSYGIGSKPPYSFPNGSSIGTLYTREQLTAEIASRGTRIPVTDEQGHGTAATGVAAGNGNNSRGVFAGVAPEADIIMVRIGGTGHGMPNAYLLNAAVAWIDSVARSEGRPVVFSYSVGGQSGGHDGLSIEERELSARFASNVPGRAIVIAAGNDRRNGLHSQAAFQGDAQPAVFAWKSETTSHLFLYFHSQSGEIPDPKQLQLAPLEVSVNGQPQQLPVPQLVGHAENPLSHDLMLEFASPVGWAGLKVWSASGSPLIADGYIPFGGKFDPSIQRVAEIVATPGTTASAITVGSYDWNDQFNYQGRQITVPDLACGTKNPMQVGDLSCYSSIGYSRGGTIKPDITSPGEWYSASYAKYPDGTGIGPKENYSDSSGYYMLFNGTSAATPYTAGIVALMLQKKPNLTCGEIKTLLELNATQDNYTGAVPNPGWGYGKLDLAAVRSILNAIH